MTAKELADKPAFPRPFSHTEGRDGSYCRVSQSGMTLRQHYTGLAMQAILSNAHLLKSLEINHKFKDDKAMCFLIGQLAITQADSQIEALAAKS